MEEEEEEMGSEETEPSSKTTRKRSESESSSRTRKASSLGHSVINLPGTKREIREKDPTGTIGNTCNVSNYEYDYDHNMPMLFSDAQYCYSLLEAMPLPEPVWSTTEPSVMAEPPLPEASIEGSVDLEWGESQASSYSWWLGFLESLDGDMSSEKMMKCPFVENVEMEDCSKDMTDQTCCLDDWLMIPSMEKDLGDLVVP